MTKNVMVYLPEALKDKLKDLQDETGQPMSTIFQNLLIKEHDELMKKKYGSYAGSEVARRKLSGSDKKESLESTIQELKNADAPSLTQHLRDIGYFELPAVLEDNNTMLYWKEIKEETDGSKSIYHCYRDTVNGLESSTPGISFNQLVADLIKKKLI